MRQPELADFGESVQGQRLALTNSVGRVYCIHYEDNVTGEEMKRVKGTHRPCALFDACPIRKTEVEVSDF